MLTIPGLYSDTVTAIYTIHCSYLLSKFRTSIISSPLAIAQAFSKEDFNGGISSLMARIVGSPETFVVSNIKSSLLRRFVSDSVVVNVGGRSVGIVGYVSRYMNVSGTLWNCTSEVARFDVAHADFVCDIFN